MPQSPNKTNELLCNDTRNFTKTESQISLTSYCGCCGFLCFSKSNNDTLSPYSPASQNKGNPFINEYLPRSENQHPSSPSFFFPQDRDLVSNDDGELIVHSTLTCEPFFGNPQRRLSSSLPLQQDVTDTNSADPGQTPLREKNNSKDIALLPEEVNSDPVLVSKEATLKDATNNFLNRNCLLPVINSPNEVVDICTCSDHSESYENRPIDTFSPPQYSSDMHTGKASNHTLCTEAVTSDHLNQAFTSNGSGTRTRSLLESRRGSHTSLTLTIAPVYASNNHLQVPHYAERTSSGGCFLPGSRIPNFSFSASHFRGVSPSLCGTRSLLPRSRPPPARHSSVGDSIEDTELEERSIISSPSSSPLPRMLTPNITEDKKKLSSGSIPLTGEALQQKLRKEFSSLFSEFWSIPANHLSKSDFPLPGVCQKNRYPSILPNNETRVILPPNNDDLTSTYINANFITGYRNRPGDFIATQGPMPHTVDDFWRMVWFVRAPAIVMLTKLVERSRVKCELYLPDSKDEHRTSVGRFCTPNRADTVPDAISVEDRVTNARLLQSARSFPPPSPRAHDDLGQNLNEADISRIYSPVGSEQSFGSIHVQVVSLVAKRGYTKRQLTLRQGDEERNVTHFWCTSWPDHSSPDITPSAAHHLLNLVFEVEGCRHSHPNQSVSFSSPPTPATTFDVITPSMLRRAGNFRRQQATEDIDAVVQRNSPISSSSIATPSPLINCPSTDETFSFRGNRASDPVQLPSLNPGPIVVHCSAGIGRTGCFIALCIGCQQLREENMVDIFGIVSRLRLDRGGMIEDHSQYAFLHIALSIYYSLQRGLTPPDIPDSDLAMGFPRPG